MPNGKFRIYHRRERTLSRSVFSAVIFLFALCSVTFGYSYQFANGEFGSTLRWKSNKLRISLSPSLTTDNSDPSIIKAVRRSMRAWEAAANVEFIEVASEKVSVSPAGRSGDGVSLITIAPTAENLAFFEDNPLEVSGRTRVFYNSKGLISEADVVLNPLVRFSDDGTFGTFDLESTITHEIGHMLGLEHSLVMGAMMHSHQGRNGIYGLSTNRSRLLSSDDIVAVRSLYPYSLNDETCCAGINGKIASKGISQSLQIWLEEYESGRVITGFETKSNGLFKVSGLPAGKYRVFVSDKANVYSPQYLGDVSLRSGVITNFSRSIKLQTKSLSVEYAGSNGQLSDVAVETNSNTSVLVYVGGKNLNPLDVEVSFSSPYLSVSDGSIVSHDFGNEISVISFDLKVDQNAKPGNYSINIRNSSGEIASLIGGITIF